MRRPHVRGLSGLWLCEGFVISSTLASGQVLLTDRVLLANTAP